MMFKDTRIEALVGLEVLKNNFSKLEVLFKKKITNVVFRYLHVKPSFLRIGKKTCSFLTKVEPRNERRAMKHFEIVFES